MKDFVYVVVNLEGFQRTYKTTGFQLKAGERAFKLELEIPDEVFSPPQLPTVKMSIPRDALITEISVDTSVPNDPDAEP